MEGILTKQQEKGLAKIIDDAIKTKGFLELVDGYAAKIIVTIIDDKVLDKIPEDLKRNLSDLVTAALAEDINQIESKAADILNGLIDIPGIDEDGELMIFEGGVKIIIGSIKKWISK